MESKEGVSFNGRRIHQLENFEFRVDMHKFVCERLSPVQLSKGRRSEPQALANDSEINQMRAVIVPSTGWPKKTSRRFSSCILGGKHVSEAGCARHPGRQCRCEAAEREA